MPTCPFISVQQLGENPEAFEEPHVKYTLCNSVDADTAAPSTRRVVLVIVEMRYILIYFL